MMRLGVLTFGAILCLSLDSSCSSDPVSTCPSSTKIDRFKELLIVEPSVVDDTRTKNSTNGPWSFRYAIENMAPMGVAPGDFVRKWLVDWVAPTQLNGYPLDKVGEGRQADMTTRILCPWQKETPSNMCNDDCSMCAATSLDLAKSHFRLIAFANRIDLHNQPDSASAGEARLVFGLTNGAADDPQSTPLPMAVIFEYRMPGRTLKEWAQTWHALGAQPDFGEGYKNALVAVTDAFVRRGADPAAQNGSALSQVRTNESVLNWIWQFREFKFGKDGYLSLVPLRNTPAESLNGSAELQDFIKKNAKTIADDTYLLPDYMRAGSATGVFYTWAFPGLDEPTRRSFAKTTCNGCHSVENPAVDANFQLTPFHSGLARVSPFLHDPTNKQGDELSKREKVVADILCAP